ncbi:hypothetical protein H6F86_01875 [Phormidium sp. FACHB-592]|uniref:ABC transporter permease n=1 Tax=Stenomitos frigidus AS-A4 TaxID=2933935 RepID=A0ABV0KPJ8_9CYAN|nr:hypothetical protein [Phormidium sp. FACHB-592]MBD2072654.1 hypothetical protein [Phormidium sp. FACHB-592]
MALNWLHKFSDWNPQVFRELKGRLKRHHVLLTVLGSLITQLFVLLFFWSVLPVARSSNLNTYTDDLYVDHNAYCTGEGSYRSLKCLYDSLGNPLVNWQRWWFDVFQAISWVLPFVLLIAGVYLLIGDLGKEERRGTLNFIRLSPQTSQKILLGKLLGVPAVPYLAVLLALPLHGLAAIAAGMPISDVLSFYLLTTAVCAFCYTAALLYALMGGVQGWTGAVVVWMSYTLFYQLWHSWSDSSLRLQWFYFLINGSRTTALTFALLTLGTGTYGLWQAVNRRFRNPDLTLLSKRQSYGMTLCFEVWLIGFVFRDLQTYEHPFYDLIGLGFFNLLWYMVLFAALTPQRQMLIDWARYRRERVTSAKQFWSRSIVKDLLWSEKSPALVAITLNLLITAIVVTPWVLSWSRPNSSPREGLVTIILGSTFTLICAAIAQLMMFMKSPKRAVWAAGTVAAVGILPPVMFAILGVSYSKVPLTWLFPFGAFATFQQGVSMTTAFTAFLGHLGILSLLSLRLTRQLKRAGESEMKALLAASRG